MARKRPAARPKTRKRYAKIRKTKTAKPAPAKRARKSLRPRKSPRPRMLSIEAQLAPSVARGLGSRSAGQSGDTQGLATSEAGSESVESLLEEGQTYEAEAVQGVEDALDADQGEVRTHETSEDDVPEEYRNSDNRDVDH